MKYMTGRPTMTRMGPNDARRVVWAIGKLGECLYIYLILYYSI